MEITSWLIAGIILVVNTILLVWLFSRKSKEQEEELNKLLNDAKAALQKHKEIANSQANIKVQKAFTLIRRLQSIAADLEGHVQIEYEEIINDAKKTRKEIISQAKKEAEKIIHSADAELEEYKQARRQEIEKNLVKLIISVTEKVVGKTLTYDDHIDLIQEALNDVKKRKERI